MIDWQQIARWMRRKPFVNRDGLCAHRLQARWSGPPA